MKKNAITLAVTLVAAGSIFAAIGYNGSHMAQAGENSQSEQQATKTLQQPLVQESLNLQQVAVQMTTSASYQAQVVGYGETRSRYQLNYASEVSGRVITLSDDFETGKVVTEGTILAKLDDTSYQQALAQAKSDVATAELELLEEQREGEQAKSEWQRSGLDGEPNSPLVLRQPQLASAEANLANAKQALKKAEKDLKDTEIRAPFKALVVSREVQPGSYLSAGSIVATLYSIERVEVEVSLSEQQWSNLPTSIDIKNWQVTLTDTSDAHQWTGRVERKYQHVTQDTRQRSLVVVVDKPLEADSPLYPGTFVKATLSGAEVNGLWEVPASAISQQGEIWTVDEQGLLNKSNASKRFSRDGKVYVTPSLAEERAQVVVRPLSNFKPGMKVTPSEEG
ncbi:efflux RND transporter periplasmic adaptor subunit [Vibrio neptunius]|uniref:Efflux RND transporter periplasmic adaptor subunit n=1 Tax=Vibrio neptunius TaxID=170651 RepID=A0ABS3A4L2_9VIBR|nr:efflux RND transporter periplasmic adaptor subunit [Vibrio neptunius]MBN3494440.1 efflux RND transporter periplasmic adaptor subunit [Vibrio neptunius]MBN3517004.1 efflux RND transporter periplasmic adaptor subunit [Vibrio neptunius]MBN3551284.1 efflux RND transporter periplasmic adaptor subunit [Vibrio neptunius]MBN3579400.1 efflux RND transporter periplasmic adaptor subunit [Vibrio neptunius]MCH9873064.1 efflux RND transporter periplasmic adaptor subunit [Vibrio neptunius]